MIDVQVGESSHVVSHWSVTKRLCLHFYSLEVTLDQLYEIEKKALNAKDYGSEVRKCLVLKRNQFGNLIWLIRFLAFFDKVVVTDA